MRMGMFRRWIYGENPKSGHEKDSWTMNQDKAEVHYRFK